MAKHLAPVPLSALAIAMLAITPLAPASGMLTLSVCGADGVYRTVSVPVDRDRQDRDDCAQACHGFCSRKHLADDDEDDTDA